MKNLILFFLLAISQVNIYGQNCVYDSFNNRSEWTIVDDNIGNNKLKITNNSLNFDSVNCAKQSRAYKNVSIFKYWDFKFSIYINGFRSKIPAAFALG